MEVLAQLITDQLISEGVGQIDAMKAAGTIVDRLRESYGGRKFYIPSERSHVNMQIAQDLDRGIPPKEVAKQHDVGLATVYRVIHRRRRQREDQDDDASFGSKEWQL